MANITLHENPHDWCHICGSRFYPTADISYPKNAEVEKQHTLYIRICADCATRIVGVTNPDHEPQRAKTTFDKRLSDAEKLIRDAVSGFHRHIHGNESDRLQRVLNNIRRVRERYQ